MTKKPELKPWRSIESQLDLLIERKMHISNAESAKHLLSTIGYYRLSGYWYPYRQFDPSTPKKRLDIFQEDTHFNEIEVLYNFDRKLKLLMLRGIEQVEVALRTRVGHLLGEYGPLSYENPSNFRPNFEHTKWLNVAANRVARAEKRDDFIDHHMTHYDKKIPIWVLTDILDFSDLSKLFSGMASSDQRKVSDWFKVTMPPNPSRNARKQWTKNPPLANWFEHLTVVRNICAHHGRLWNRTLTPVGVPSRIRHLEVFKEVPEDHHQVENIFGTICILTYLLQTISPTSTWRTEVNALIDETFPMLPHRRTEEMGFYQPS